MTLRPDEGRVDPAHPQIQGTRDPLVHTEQDAIRRALERAYPLLKQAAEILELEAIEPQATATKRIRQEVGSRLAELGAEQEHRSEVAVPRGER